MTLTIFKGAKCVRCMAVLRDAHRTASIWFGYLVAVSIVLKSSDIDLAAYLSPRWQHALLGAASVLMILDKIRRSIGATTPEPLPPPEMP